MHLRSGAQMHSRPVISLFPFLSVLICTMGVLSFLAVTFLLMSSSSKALPKPAEKPVQVRWVGAPDYVRPLLVECRGDGALLRGDLGTPDRFFSKAALAREVNIVRSMEEAGVGRLGLGMGRQTLWLYFKSALDQERRLEGSFTLLMHHVELSNLTGENHRHREEHYPILLVYPDGVDTFDQVTYLVETTTRLSTGVEPMLPGWTLPRLPHSS